MDPFSLATGVAGLLQLALDVGTTIYKLQASYKSASKSLSELADEVASVSSALTSLQQRIDALRLTTKSSSKIVLALEVPLTNCRGTLEAIQRELGGGGEVSIRKKISWALKDEEKVEGYRQRLARDKIHFTLMLQLDMGNHLDGIDITLETIRNDTLAIQDLKSQQEQKILKEEREKQDSEKRSLIKWLNPFDYNEKLETVLAQRLPNTCTWLLKNEEVKKWMSEQGYSLWLHGIPGNGKTVLASALIDHFQSTNKQDENRCLVYVYCDFRQPETQDTARILQTMLAELVLHHDGEMSSLHHLTVLQKERKNPPTALAKLLDLFEATSKLWENINIVIDGLDECKNRETILSAINQLVKTGRVSFFLSSRNEPDIAEALDDFVTISLISDNWHNVQSDIDLYIREEFSSKRNLRKLPANLRDISFSRLSEKADGMFRWVQCQLDFIATRKTIKSVQEALDNLPESLYSTYERILNNIEESGEETSIIAKKALKWILGSLSELTLPELAEAIMIEPKATTLNEELTLLSPSIILDVCSSLLIHDVASDTITISHFSVQEYLFSKHLQDTPLADYYFISSQRVQVDLSILLITFVTLPEFERKLCATEGELRELVEDHPLLPYASDRWEYHLRLVDVQDEDLYEYVLEKIIDGSDLLCHRLTQQVAWLVNRKKDFSELTWPTFSRHCYHPVTHLLVVARPLWLIDRILGDRPYVGSLVVSAWAGDPLSIACGRLLDDLLDMLLKHNADVEKVTTHIGRSLSPLFYAVTWKNLHAAKVLIEHGAKIGGALAGGWTPLHEAVHAGYIDCVRLLVEAGCDVNAVTTSGRTPVVLALEKQRRDIAEYLIEHGATMTTVILPQSHVDWIRSEPWDARAASILALTLPDAGAGRKELSREQVAEIISYFPQRLPQKIISAILDMAECWAVSTAERDELVMYTHADEGTGRDEYLSITITSSSSSSVVPVPSENTIKVRQIVFTTVSHDQGWSDYPESHGTYRHSHTWFDAAHSHPCSPTSLGMNWKHIQFNVHASDESRTHTVIFDYRDPELEGWMAELREGSVLTVYARARYPGWVNYVEKVQIAVYSSSV